jgi:hypothetical protein
MDWSHLVQSVLIVALIICCRSHPSLCCSPCPGLPACLPARHRPHAGSFAVCFKCRWPSRFGSALLAAKVRRRHGWGWVGCCEKLSCLRPAFMRLVFRLLWHHVVFATTVCVAAPQAAMLMLKAYIQVLKEGPTAGPTDIAAFAHEAAILTAATCAMKQGGPGFGKFGGLG